MTQQPVEVDAINWKRAFPWVRVFRAFRTAIDLRMLFLGCIGLVALAVGDSVFQRLPFAPVDARASWEPFRDQWDQPLQASDWTGMPEAVVRHSGHQIARGAAFVLEPLRTVIDPAWTILRADVGWAGKAYAWTRLLWALCVWAVIGGAMTRIAAVEQTREARVKLATAVRFSLDNFFSYMTAALLPVVAIGIFWLLCTIGGWIGLIPFVGRPLLGLLWGLELIFGFIMAMVLIGAVPGWPLMYSTISTEASDGFDGFSRAYSYVISRPWHYAWFALIALAYGAIVATFVLIVANLVAYLSAAGVSSGMGVNAASSMVAGAPPSLGGANLLSNTAPLTGVDLGTTLTGTWLKLVELLVMAFLTSYFWTATEVVYLLLRQVDDATDFHEVYMPPEKEQDELLPLVGVAASSQPIIERPPEGDFADPPPGLPKADPIDGQGKESVANAHRSDPETERTG